MKPNGVDKKLAREFRHYRHSLGLTQEEMAKVLNISRETVNRAERGLFSRLTTILVREALKDKIA